MKLENDEVLRELHFVYFTSGFNYFKNFGGMNNYYVKLY